MLNDHKPYGIASWQHNDLLVNRSTNADLIVVSEQTLNQTVVRSSSAFVAHKERALYRTSVRVLVDGIEDLLDMEAVLSGENSIEAERDHHRRVLEGNVGGTAGARAFAQWQTAILGTTHWFLVVTGGLEIEAGQIDDAQGQN